MVTQSPDRNKVEQLVRQLLRQQTAGPTQPGPSAPVAGKPLAGNQGAPNPLVVNVSARHVHVSQTALDALFGPGSSLTKLKDLYQPGEFASNQTVNIIGPRNRMIPNVRILGPIRDYTQVELSYTDGIYMGIDLPMRVSGNLEGTPSGVLIGPYGAYNMEAGIIRAERHVHMGPADLAYFGVKNGDYMDLVIEGPCATTFQNVLVREHPKVKLEIHIDTDEGNACHLNSATRMELIKK